MARIQVLPLPPEVVGEVRRTPFLIVLDEASNLELPNAAEDISGICAQFGARGVLVFDKTVDVVA